MCGQLSTATKMTLKTLKPVKVKSQGISENSLKMKGARPMSNDPCLNVKVFCNLCDGVYQMSGLRKHIAHRHKMTKAAYIAGFGDIKKQIISLVHHSCGICKKTMLLDTDIISKHTTKKHKIGYTAYAGKYMKKNSGLIKKEKTSDPKVVKKKSPEIPSAQPSFGKEFWMNILSKKSGSSTSNSASSSSKSSAVLSPVSMSSPKLTPKTPAKKSSSPSVRKSPETQTPRPAISTSKKSIKSTIPPPSSPVLPPTPPATPPVIKVEPVVKKEKEDIVMTDISPPAPVKNPVVIQCQICSKTFSKNIQLRAHSRKNHL